MTQPAGAGAAGLPATVDTLAAAIVALYAQAEQDLLAALARVARHGLSDTAGQAQLVMYGLMRREAERAVTALALKSGPLAQQVTATAAQRGDAAALAMIRRAVEGSPALARLYLAREAGASGHGIAAAAQIGLDLSSRLQSTWQGIVRFANDAYRAATAEAATRLVLGREGLTPATAQRMAWSELTRAGITGYTDTTGRRWNLSSYVEMATRTTVQRAYNAAHEARMTAVGIRYFTISHDGRPCPLCKPWEGAVLSNGITGPAVEPHAIRGEAVRFTVKATVDQARAAGLFHPNCRHVLLPYLPGVTKTGGHSDRWTKADEARYQATQRLRQLERGVRAAKRAQLAAVDDLAAARARREIRALQARIRHHVDQHGLVRRPRREQLDLGNH